MRVILLLLTVLLAAPAALLAQQSSKSKSKSKLYEKGNENKNVRVTNIRSLNSPNTDYSPAWYQNGIVYVSSRKKSGPQDKKTGETFFELYFAPFDPNGEPTVPENFSIEINSAAHEGPVTFSRDWKTMFFTRNNMVKGVQVADNSGVVRLKIYEARRGKHVWENQIELPFNSDSYSCMHPTLSADGQKLYFASDMPGGEGGFDLYVSYRSPADGGWEKPINLGKTINSDKNEVFPFIHPSGTMFFASNGHNSIGGLDIFFAENDKSTGWVVTNMGEPFNSAKDDLGIILNDDATGGFFSSDREPGYGKDDIFGFTVEQGVHGVSKPESKQLKVLVSDAKTGAAIRGAAIRILEPSGDGFASSRKKDLYDIQLLPDASRENTLSLQLVRKDADQLGDADLFSNAVGEALHNFMPYRSYLLVVSADGYLAGDKVLSFEPSEEPGIIKIGLEQAPACVPVRGTLATEQHGTRIEAGALRFRHKDSGRIAVANTNSNGEFGACLPGDGEYLVYLEKSGYVPENVPLTVVRDKDNFAEFRLKPTKIAAGRPTAPLVSGPLEEGKVIVIDKIYYDYNKATLNEVATRYLDELVELMNQYPEMEIDLISHTDTRGEARANLALSQERAQNAKKYLMFRKIEAARVNAIGRGEAEPRNHCKEGATCSEEEHQYNRRTEIVVRKIGGNVKVEYKKER